VSTRLGRGHAAEDRGGGGKSSKYGGRGRDWKKKLADAVEAYLKKLLDRDRNALIAVKAYMLTTPDLDTHGAARLGAAMIATVFLSQEK
jgi:hypothetical protein